ncbi:MAG: hypothetical protein OHK0029_02980 [Armatimonadaceae bacterium]
MNNIVLNKTEIIDSVEKSLAQVSLPDELTLTVDASGIVASEVGGKTWWRVPVIPTPYPERKSSLYDVLAEAEGILQDEQGLDILLFPGLSPTDSGENGNP